LNILTIRGGDIIDVRPRAVNAGDPAVRVIGVCGCMGIGYTVSQKPGLGRGQKIAGRVIVVIGDVPVLCRIYDAGDDLISDLVVGGWRG